MAVIGGFEIQVAVRFEDDRTEGRTLFPEVILIEAVHMALQIVAFLLRSRPAFPEGIEEEVFLQGTSKFDKN